MRKLIAAAACAASLAVAGPAVGSQGVTRSTDVAGPYVNAGDNEVAVEGITLDHEGFEILEPPLALGGSERQVVASFRFLPVVVSWLVRVGATRLVACHDIGSTLRPILSAHG